MTKKYFNKSKIATVLCACLLLVASFAESSTTSPLSLKSIPLLKLPKQSDDPVHYSAHGHAFSHDSRLFAVFLPGQEGEKNSEQYTEGSITVWDTETGKIKYQTVVPRYFTTYPYWEALDIRFSPDDKMILSSRGMRSDLITWKFTKQNQASIICRVGGRNEIEEVIQISPDNNVLFIQGINRVLLCGQNGEMDIPYPFNNRFSWPFGTRILHNKQLLLLQNVYPEHDPPADSFENEKKQTLKKLTRKQHQHFVLWDLGYRSKANQMIKAVDTDNQRFLVFEAFDHHAAVSQWDYANRQWLNKQFFKDLQIEPIDNESGYWRPLVKFTDDYVLLHSKGRLTLFVRQGHEVSLLWSKHTPMLSDGDDPYFSRDRQYIVLNNHAMINIQSGKLTNRKPYPKSAEIILIEPVASKRVKERYLHRNRHNCPSQVKSQLYDLTSDKVVKEIEGTVLAMSPDGKVLAVCKDKELFLYRLWNT